MTSTVQSAQADVLSQIFQGLKNQSHEVRLESSVNLRRYVNFSVISDVWRLMLMSRLPLLLL
ncbi:hypothetical protein EV421DRAFT_1791668, partial [Armillaria borealis]